MVKVFIGAKSAKMGMKKSFLTPLTNRKRTDKIKASREGTVSDNIDIDDLVATISAGIYGDDRMSWSTIEAATTALSQLVEEMRWLREERPSVVAWLDSREEELNAEGEAALREGHRTWAFDCASEAARAALAIERGEHRREE